MPPIRQILTGVALMIIFMYLGVSFMGDFIISNNLPTNKTVQATFNSILLNQSNPDSLVYITSNVATNFQSVSRSLANLDVITLITSTVSLVANMVTLATGGFGAILTFIALPFQIIGIGNGIPAVMFGLVILIVVVLAIISAIFLFPT